MLTDKYIKQFKQHDYTIIENILSQEKVNLTRINLHNVLKINMELIMII